MSQWQSMVEAAAVVIDSDGDDNSDATPDSCTSRETVDNQSLAMYCIVDAKHCWTDVEINQGITYPWLGPQFERATLC